MLARSALWVLCGFLPAASTLEGATPKHEAGRCAMRGHCGKQGFFGKELPCPDNGLAEDPDEDLREKIVDTCGEKWAEGAVCCNEDQVTPLYPFK